MTAAEMHSDVLFAVNVLNCLLNHGLADIIRWVLKVYFFNVLRVLFIVACDF